MGLRLEDKCFIKPSKYNFIYEDESSDYLLCNLLSGTYSFLRINKDDINAVNAILQTEKIEYQENSLLHKELYSRGYLINYNEDEILKIQSKYNDVAFDNCLNLIIMTTEQCNFRCKYCYEDYSLGEMLDTVQKSIIGFIQKNMYRYSYLSIEWFGGEPLEGFNVIKNITEKVNAICTQRKAIYKYGITTNGYNLLPKIFDELYNMRIFNYQITLDGCKDQHDQQRVLEDGTGTFDKIVNNLMFIKNNPLKYPKANITI